MVRKNAVVSLMAMLVLTLGASVAARAESQKEIDVAVSDTLQRFTAANPAQPIARSKLVIRHGDR